MPYVNHTKLVPTYRVLEFGIPLNRTEFLLVRR